MRGVSAPQTAEGATHQALTELTSGKVDECIRRSGGDEGRPLSILLPLELGENKFLA